MKINYRAYFPSSKTRWHVYKLELRVSRKTLEFLQIYNLYRI